MSEYFQDWDKWFQLFCELCIKHDFKYEIGKLKTTENWLRDCENTCYVTFGTYRAEARGEIHLWQAACVTFLNSPADSGSEGE